MYPLISAICEHLSAKEPVVLCTVLASSGSSPRGAGARMAVFADGSACGTVGGGAVELIAAQQAAQALAHRSPRLSAFNLNSGQVNDIGMICGGAVTIYYQVFDPADTAASSTLEKLRALLRQNADAWLLLKLEHETVTEFAVYAKDELPAERRELFSTRAVLTKGEPMYYTEPVSRKGRVVIFGGGHVGKALAAVLPQLAFRVTVYDNRPDFARTENFPGAEQVVLGEYQSLRIDLQHADYAVIMTPGHQADYEVLRQVLPMRPSYIGCIGSKNKIARTNERLLADGFSQQELAGIHAPIGLPILAETPEEIAISIAAELIRHRKEQVLGAET